MKTKGFTLVQLMVGIAIVAGVLSILIPALDKRLGQDSPAGQIVDNFSEVLSDKDTVWIYSAVKIAPHDTKWLILFSRLPGQPLRAVWFGKELTTGKYVWLATDKEMLLVPPPPMGKVGVKPGEG